MSALMTRLTTARNNTAQPMTIRADMFFDSTSNVRLSSKAIVVLAIALFFCACSSGGANVGNAEKNEAAPQDFPLPVTENAALLRIKKDMEEKRRKDGSIAVGMLAPFKKDQSEGAISQPDFDRIKAQMDLMYLGIGEFVYRHELDLALMRYAVSVAEKVRPQLAARIKNGLKIPESISAYLKETLLADFEQKSAEAIKHDLAELDFWNIEREKWRKSWEEKTYDYVLPAKPRGQFLFDFDRNSEENLESLKNVEEALRKQFESEINGALKNHQQ